MRRVTAPSQLCGPTLFIIAAISNPAMQPDACSQQRSGEVLEAVRFPILTFDEWQPGRPPGRGFMTDWLLPGESLVSILWKFACANALPGDVLMRLICPDADPLKGVIPLRSALDLAQLRRLLRLPVNVCAHRCSTGRRESRTTRLSGIAGSVRRTATIVCCISLRRKIAVRPESVHYQQQRDRSAIPLCPVSFTFLLWAPPAPFDDAGDATAGPPRDPGASASTTRQWCLGRVERVIAGFRCRPPGSRPPTLLTNDLWRS
jgi:hypothetical protein